MGAEGTGVLARAALRHDPVERVSVAGAAVPRRGRQLHDGGASGRRRLDPDAQVRRRGRPAPDREHRVTHAQFVPTMFVRMLKLPEAMSGSRYDVSSLQCVIHAAAPCPVDVKHQMMDWFGPIIHEYYGGTEGFAGTIIGPDEWLAHPGIGRQTVQPGARRRRGRGRTCLSGSPASSTSRAGPAVRVLQGPREDGIGVQRARLAVAG